jgi:hypothetical protein
VLTICIMMIVIYHIYGSDTRIQLSLALMIHRESSAALCDG